MACSCSVFSPAAAAVASSELQRGGGGGGGGKQQSALRRSVVRSNSSLESKGNQKCEGARDDLFRPLGCFHLLGDEEDFSRYGVVAVESTPRPPKQKKGDQKGKDYHVNVGYAIRSLREELPGMFYKEPTFDIYREDIVFRDPLITFTGIKNYRLMFWGLRFYGRVFFRAIWIEIQRIWQPSDRVIMIRWTVYGVPRVPWEARGQFDGTSEYKLDADGLIYQHKVDNLVLNSPPKYKAPAVIDLVVAAGAAPQAPATPSFIQSLLQRFTWVRFYVALRSTLTFAEGPV